MSVTLLDIPSWRGAEARGRFVFGMHASTRTSSVSTLCIASFVMGPVRLKI
jgi:hypothetical protein